jgi:glycosyltransferase
MTISIITATFNAEKTVETAIKSVLQQTYTDIEYIIVDGGSTDRTLSIIERYKNNIHHLISEPDQGIYDALNKGISLATGQIIAFLHADDLYVNDGVIAAVAKAFAQNTCDAVYGDLEYVQFQNPNKVIRYWKSQVFKPSLLKTGWMPPHPTLFVRKSIYDTIGHFNLHYKIAADYDFVLRLFSKKEYTFYYLPHVIIRMRLGGASNKSIKNIVLKSREDMQALKQNRVGSVFTLIWKNLSKLPQFIKR